MDGRPHKRRGYSPGQPRRSRREHITAVKGRSGCCQTVLLVVDLPNLRARLLFEHFAEQSVVWADEHRAGGGDEQWPAGRADPGVDDGDMNRPVRKVTIT